LESNELLAVEVLGLLMNGGEVVTGKVLERVNEPHNLITSKCTKILLLDAIDLHQAQLLKISFWTLSNCAATPQLIEKMILDSDIFEVALAFFKHLNEVQVP